MYNFKNITPDMSIGQHYEGDGFMFIVYPKWTKFKTTWIFDKKVQKEERRKIRHHIQRGFFRHGYKI